jgi:hypothetical protein
VDHAEQPSDRNADASPGNEVRAVDARSLKYLIAAVCVAGLAVPWVVLTAFQKSNPATPMQVVVPAGAKVTVLKSSAGSSAGVSVVTGPGSTTGTTGTTTTTRASVPPP